MKIQLYTTNKDVYVAQIFLFAVTIAVAGAVASCGAKSLRLFTVSVSLICMVIARSTVRGP